MADHIGLHSAVLLSDLPADASVFSAGTLAPPLLVSNDFSISILFHSAGFRLLHIPI
jgi:hypothetical protein